MSQPPSKIKVHRKARELELAYDDTTALRVPCELLRVYSPSAEVRGHSASERRLQTGKKYVNIERVEPVGSYAIRICFDDGHDSGIYSWAFLEDLARHQERYWQQYLAELAAVNASRLPTIPVGRWTP
jgi:DUF971 family protein